VDRVGAGFLECALEAGFSSCEIVSLEYPACRPSSSGAEAAVQRSKCRSTAFPPFGRARVRGEAAVGRGDEAGIGEAAVV
jgi:hypothetical protein